MEEISVQILKLSIAIAINKIEKALAAVGGCSGGNARGKKIRI